MTQWDRTSFTIETDDSGTVILKATSVDNPGLSVTFKLNHETAAKIGEALLIKAAYVEYYIQAAVERMAKFE